MTLKPRIRFAWCLGLLALVSLAFIPATLAVDPPAISVNPVWRPTSQLDSINPNNNGVTDAGDDLRYVDGEIYVTTSVQFWAVDVTCTVDKTVLETYTPNTDNFGGPAGNGVNAPDDVQIVTEGPEWKNGGAGNFQKVVNSNTFNTDGKINFALTRIGLAAPMGGNGVKTTFLLATLRYRVKDLPANAVFPKTSALACTAVFLDKNGKSVLLPTVVAPAPLTVLGGYTIKGKVMYQAQTVQTGIVVNCKDANDVDHFAGAVTAAGDFTVSTRVLGSYNCFFYGSKINANQTTPDAHLTSQVSFNMNSTTYTLLPVTLRAGNVDRTDSYIGFGDINAITTNWNATGAAYTLGDANGDGKTNNVDLALTSGNIYTYFTPEHIVNASHLIYSLPRDNEKFMNSRIWLGGYYGDQSVSQFVPGVDRNYWATLSPDGSKIAFVRNIGVGNADKFTLMVAPVTGGVVGAAVNITPNAPFDAFAPSWSPDGTTLGFACAYSRGDWTDGRANLCLVSSNGANLRQKIALSASNNQINIHPVAWFNNTSMMYSSPSYVLTPMTPPACHYQICILDLTTMQNFPDPRTTFGSDMPTIRWGAMGPTLFYRYSAGATSKLRLAELNETNLYPITTASAIYAANCTQTAGNKHCDVINSSSVTFTGYDKVGYFNVFTGNTKYPFFGAANNNQYGIVLYTYDISTADGGGSNLVLLTSVGDANTPAWSTYDALPYSVANSVGNPALTATDFDPSTEGYLALRNTIEWVP